MIKYQYGGQMAWLGVYGVHTWAHKGRKRQKSPTDALLLADGVCFRCVPRCSPLKIDQCPISVPAREQALTVYNTYLSSSVPSLACDCVTVHVSPWGLETYFLLLCSRNVYHFKIMKWQFYFTVSLATISFKLK